MGSLALACCTRPGSRRRAASLVLLLLPLLTALVHLAASRWRGLHGLDIRPEVPRGLRSEVNQSSASCRAAALGPVPGKDELAAIGRPLPRYMMKAAGGDEGTALRRWAETLRWRCDIGDQAILARPHPNLARISPHYPTFLHMPDREGRLTYWELIGEINQEALVCEGLNADDIVEHYIWSTLFTWDIAARDDAHEVTIIVDMAGFGLSTLTPTVLSIFMRVAKLLRKHFPQREHGIFFINAPSWSEQAYNMVAPLVSQKQRDKVRLLSADASTALLRSLIAPANLPVKYGGEGPPLGSSPLELQKRRLAATGVL
mmetsp:Transcript_58229/g.160978  ORF Transcript_58229/g.160978 Transcript_58229/m.160978 type:complete len:316 (-) Transcript_58229:99-1046(-)